MNDEIHARKVPPPPVPQRANAVVRKADDGRVIPQIDPNDIEIVDKPTFFAKYKNKITNPFVIGLVVSGVIVVVIVATYFGSKK